MTDTKQVEQAYSDLHNEIKSILDKNNYKRQDMKGKGPTLTSKPYFI